MEGQALALGSGPPGVGTGEDVLNVVVDQDDVQLGALLSVVRRQVRGQLPTRLYWASWSCVTPMIMGISPSKGCERGSIIPKEMPNAPSHNALELSQ